MSCVGVLCVRVVFVCVLLLCLFGVCDYDAFWAWLIMIVFNVGLFAG